MWRRIWVASVASVTSVARNRLQPKAFLSIMQRARCVKRGMSGMTENKLGVDMIGIVEAAQRLGVSRSTLHKMVINGSLIPDFRTPGGHARFRRETIEAFRPSMHRAEHQYAPAAQLVEDPEAARRRVLTNIARLLAAGSDTQEICRIALEDIRRTYPHIDMGYVVRHMPTPQDPWGIEVVARDHFPLEVVRTFSRLRPLHEFSATAVLRSGKVEGCEDTLTSPLRPATVMIMRQLRARSYVVVPIQVEQRTIGVIGLQSRTPRTFDASVVAFVTDVAAQLGTVLSCASREKSLRDMLGTASQLIAQALETRAAIHDDIPSAKVTLDELSARYRAASGAYAVCAIGMTHSWTSGDKRLHAIASQAWAEGAGQVDIWPGTDGPNTSIATCISLADGGQGAVAAAWHGLRDDAETDLSLLSIFGMACSLVTSPSNR